ncbi:MAG: aminotransferase class V-fold PLP-dependent enzyme [Gammaproteobacteria bacterium]|nr:aminotransferase class V-fold PLP-dependent enzyme [Gammaproteobacteria bacterium]
MYEELAECSNLALFLKPLGEDLDQYLRFDHSDATQNLGNWSDALNQTLPDQGIGIEKVLEEMGRELIPNGSQIPNPGCSAFITTGATTIGALATLAGSIASPQRFGITAFNFLEELSLQWLVELLDMPIDMKGIYSSGGSVANLLAIGAARQSAFESIGVDTAAEGIPKPGCIYATEASHHTIHRAAAVLGLGRNSVVTIAADEMGRMCPMALRDQLSLDSKTETTPIAIVANAGVTSTGAIDPLREIGEIAKEYSIWFHVDGAYGLPGILDPEIAPLFDGLVLADSVIVDPHKWLGAPVGISATFVRDRNILNRAFKQGASDYLEGSFDDHNIEHSMDSQGIPYSDFGVELSAPPRGVVVWALIREIGKEGLRRRVCRHNAMAQLLAERAYAHDSLEVVQAPTLSICCFRYITDEFSDLNELNRKIHRKVVQRGKSIPSTAMVNGIFTIRPCFIGARASWQQVDELLEEVIEVGDQLVASQ